MICPYEDIGCIYIDTAGMFKTVECYDCEHYRNDSVNPGEGEDAGADSKEPKKSG